MSIVTKPIEGISYNVLNPNSVVTLLTDKLKELKKNQTGNNMFEKELCDYIAIKSFDIEKSIQDLKDYKNLIQSHIDKLNKVREEFLIQSAIVFNENSLIKIEGGDLVSSITLQPEKPSYTKDKKVFTCKHTKSEQESLLVEHGFASYETKEEFVPCKPAMLKINKRRKNNKVGHTVPNALINNSFNLLGV